MDYHSDAGAFWFGNIETSLIDIGMTLKVNNVDKEYYLVVGMGATGYSIACYLQMKGLAFHVFDTRASSLMADQFKTLAPNAELFFEKIDDEIILGAKEIYLSPGVPRDEYVIRTALANDIPVIGDIALFLRDVSVTRPNAKIVGITGSNGKSTVTTIVGLAAEKAGIKVAVGGNIGIPALDLIDVDADLYVLELSSFQLESTPTPNLTVGCILNISADHMDRYDSLAKYIMAKQQVYLGAESVVYCLDDANTHAPLVQFVAGEPQKRSGFGVSQAIESEETQYVFIPQSGWLQHEEEKLIHRDAIKIKGAHNINNALAVFAIADAAGIARSACVEVLSEFNGLPHRCEIVREFEQVTYINDSKATNVGAAEAAIVGLAADYQGIVLIAGGEGKGAEFEALAKIISRYVRALVLIGKDAERIDREVAGRVETLHAVDLSSAVKKARSVACAGDVVLLSPACASLDMFTNFEERGQVFTQAVNQLCGGAHVA